MSGCGGDEGGVISIQNGPIYKYGHNWGRQWSVASRVTQLSVERRQSRNTAVRFVR